MDICSDGHSEIVYNERNCPLCIANKEIENLEEQIRLQQEKIEDLESEIENG